MLSFVADVRRIVTFHCFNCCIDSSASPSNDSSVIINWSLVIIPSCDLNILKLSYKLIGVADRHSG